MIYFSCAVLAALALAAYYLSKKSPQGTILITDRQALDNRHALVSVQWKEKEYLLLVGPSCCVVGEKKD